MANTGIYTQNKFNLVHGSNAIFKILGPDGTPINFAYGTGVDVAEEINYEELQVLDRLAVAEFVPTTYKVRISCRMFAIFNNSLKHMTIQPLYNNILTAQDMTIEISNSKSIDPAASSHTITIHGVKFKSGSLTINAGTIEARNIEFVGMYVTYSDTDTGVDTPNLPGASS